MDFEKCTKKRMTKMEIETTTLGNCTVVTLKGRLVFDTSEAASERLMEIAENYQRIIIDMSKCTYVSSSGLRVLLLLGKRAKQLGEKMVLAKLTDDVQDIMEMTGFGSIFSCYGNLSAALDAVK